MSTPTPPPSSSTPLGGLFDRIGQLLQPPEWAVAEIQRRMVLLLNHVLNQEPEAQARLRRQVGRVVEAHWRHFHIRVQATPAGLLDLAVPGLVPDLTLTITEDSPFALGQAAVRGAKPPIRIAGDVQLAAEIQWLVDHVRWDVEEDLSRVIGDAPAHAIGGTAKRVADAIRQFAARGAAVPPADAAPPAPTAAPATPGPTAG
jgi:ubiquinone biosynthesis protein UbiJ